MDLAAVRAGLKDVLDSELIGWRVWSYVPPDPNAPAIVVGFPEVESYHVNMSDWGRITLPITVVVGRVSERVAQERLDIALSTSVDGSVVDVLDGATPSSSTWRVCRVISAGNLRIVTAGAVNDLLAADIVIELIA